MIRSLRFPFKLYVISTSTRVSIIPIRLFSTLGSFDTFIVGNTSSRNARVEVTSEINIDNVFRTSTEEETTTTEPTVPVRIGWHEIVVSFLSTVSTSDSTVISSCSGIWCTRMSSHHMIVSTQRIVGVGVSLLESNVLDIGLIEGRVENFRVTDDIEDKRHYLKREIFTTLSNNQVLGTWGISTNLGLLSIIVSSRVICNSNTIDSWVLELTIVARGFIGETKNNWTIRFSSNHMLNHNAWTSGVNHDTLCGTSNRHLTSPLATSLDNLEHSTNQTSGGLVTENTKSWSDLRSIVTSGVGNNKARTLRTL